MAGKNYVILKSNILPCTQLNSVELQLPVLSQVAELVVERTYPSSQEMEAMVFIGYLSMRIPWSPGTLTADLLYLITTLLLATNTGHVAAINFPELHFYNF